MNSQTGPLNPQPGSAASLFVSHPVARGTFAEGIFACVEILALHILRMFVAKVAMQNGVILVGRRQDIVHPEGAVSEPDVPRGFVFAPAPAAV